MAMSLSPYGRGFTVGQGVYLAKDLHTLALAIYANILGGNDNENPLLELDFLPFVKPSFDFFTPPCVQFILGTRHGVAVAKARELFGMDGTHPCSSSVSTMAPRGVSIATAT
jgi:hypothetical protein